MEKTTGYNKNIYSMKLDKRKLVNEAKVRGTKEA